MRAATAGARGGRSVPLPHAWRRSGERCALGNRNAWKHGEYKAERKAELRNLRALLHELRADAASL